MRNILSVTGTRSDWGIMQPVYQAIDRLGMEQHCIMTSMLLMPRFREDMQRVHKEFPGQVHEIAIQDSRTTNESMAEALGTAINLMAPCMARLKPDAVLLQGDRGEMLAAALVAVHLNIPAVHLSGGDRTGTVDDAIRHAISSVAHIHLPTCEQSAQELLRRGESAGRIAVVGEPGLDTILQTNFLTRAQLWADICLPEGQEAILVAQHPVTTESSKARLQMQATLEATCAFAQKHGLAVVVTAANSDAGGEDINDVIAQYAARNEVHFYSSLGAQRFLSMLRYAKALVGNSSSGIWEAPSFCLPAVNIGTRQHGRLRAANVIDVPEFDVADITDALNRALFDDGFKAAAGSCVNPYGDGHSSDRVANILAELDVSDPVLISKWLDTGRDFLEFAR